MAGCHLCFFLLLSRCSSTTFTKIITKSHGLKQIMKQLKFVMGQSIARGCITIKHTNEPRRTVMMMMKSAFIFRNKQTGNRAKMRFRGTIYSGFVCSRPACGAGNNTVLGPSSEFLGGRVSPRYFRSRQNSEVAFKVSRVSHVGVLSVWRISWFASRSCGRFQCHNSELL
jgi:hypothetical protein